MDTTDAIPAIRNRKHLVDPATGRDLTWGELHARFEEAVADAGIDATLANLDAWIENAIHDREIEEYTPARLRQRHGFHQHLNREPGLHRLVLQQGETCDQPGSTRRKIHGPAFIEYRVHVDGGIDAMILDDPPTEEPEPRMEATIPRLFYEDHVDRDLPAGEVIAESVHHVTVLLTRAEHEELLSDAAHYATEPDPDQPAHLYDEYLEALAISAIRTRDLLSKWTAEDFQNRTRS